MQMRQRDSEVEGSREVRNDVGGEVEAEAEGR